MSPLGSNMLRVALALALVPASVSAVSQTADLAPIQDRLVNGPWQVGLYGNARNIPAGLAFKRGITAAVFTFEPDGKMRVNVPCRNEEFLRSVGGEFQIDGTWTLDASELKYTIFIRGYSKTETYLVSFNGNDLEFLESEGKRLRLGRFFGDLGETCTFE
jgi:hypothetical protein